MSNIRLQLKCHQLINQLNTNALNKNSNEILSIFGGIKSLLLNNIARIASQELLYLLTNIKNEMNNTDSINYSDDINISESLNLMSFPKELILKTTEYLKISDIKHLSSTCIDMALICASELNKIDVRLVVYEDLLLKDTLTMEYNEFNDYGRLIRVNRNDTVLHAISKYYTNNSIIGFWNCNSFNINRKAIPLCYMNISTFDKRVCDINPNNLKLYAINYRLHVTQILKNSADRTLILFKYFDIKHQKLFVIDAFRVGNHAQITRVLLFNYIVNNILSKYTDLFKDVLKFKHILNIDHNFFQFYAQNGLKPNNIKVLFKCNNKPIQTDVIIFEINTSNNLLNQYNITHKTGLWKEKFQQNNQPLCLNVKAFWTYNYWINQAKKKLKNFLHNALI